MESDKKKFFLKNTISNYTVIFLRIVISLISVPLYLKAFGEVQYGIYLLSFGLITTLSFLDFGAGKSLIRYTAEYKQHKNSQLFSEAFSNSVVLVTLSSLLIGGIFILLSFFCTYFFHIPAEYATISKNVFLIAAFASVIQFLGFIPAYILQGWGIFHKRNIYQIAPIFMQIILMYWVYYSQPTLTLFTAMSAVIIICIFLADIILLKNQQVLQGIKLSFRFNSQMMKSDSFKYANQIFLLSIVGFLSSQADKLFISVISGVAAVTIYSVITKPYYLFKGLFANYYAVMQPQFVKANVTSDNHEMKTLIISSTRLALTIVWVFVLCICFYFTQLLEFWLGPNNYGKYWPWGVLALVNLFISALYGSVFRVMFVTGKTNFLFRMDSVTASINAIISISLTILFGWYGVIAGTTVQLVCVLIVLSNYGKKHYSLGLLENIGRSYILFFLITLTVSSLIFYIYNLQRQYWPFYFGIQFIFLSIAGYYRLKKDPVVRMLI